MLQKNRSQQTNKMVKQASESLCAYFYLDNSDHEKYGSNIKNMSYQKSLGNDQYPRMIIETNNVLSNQKFNLHKYKK